MLDTTLCDKVCQWLVAGRWFSFGTLVSSTNKSKNWSPRYKWNIGENTQTLYMFFYIGFNSDIFICRLSVPGPDVKAVYKAAVKLKIVDAAKTCSKFLAANLSVANCLGILNLPIGFYRWMSSFYPTKHTVFFPCFFSTWPFCNLVWIGPVLSWWWWMKSMPGSR